MKRFLVTQRVALPVALLILGGVLVWQGKKDGLSGVGRVGVTDEVVREGSGVGASGAMNFERWVEAVAVGEGVGSVDVKTGVALARQRMAMLEELARKRPAAARARLMALAELAALPEEVRRECEQPWSGVADFDLRWETSLTDEGTISCRHRHVVSAGDFSAEAYGAHLMEATRPLAGVFLQGHRIGDVLLLDEAVARRLEGDEAEVAGEWFGDAGVGTDPVSGVEVSEGISAVVGGLIYPFESDETLAAFEATMEEAAADARRKEQRAVRNPFPVLADTGDGGGGGPVEEAPDMDDDIDVLFIRVDFSDFAGEANSISKAGLEAVLSNVANRVDQYSYGKASITYTVSNTLYRMPATGASYALAGNNNGIRDAARALAAANYTLANYDVVAVYFPRLTNVVVSQITYGGLAGVGYGDHWINGTTNVGVMLHEFGHNYGLFHANFWNPDNDLGGVRNDDPNLDSLEYGDIFDTMGGGSDDKGYFSPYATYRLGWMPNSKVITPSANGTFRIHRFDSPGATSQATLALRVPMGGDVYYWVGHRKLHGAPSNLSSAAYVVAEGLYEDRPNLIDMTPNSNGNAQSDRNDCGLVVGGVLNDTVAGVRFETVAAGGAAGSEWVDVNVQFDPRIEVVNTAVDVDEAGGVARVTLRRNFGSATAASVNYTTANGTATAGTDYHAVSGTVTWGAGDTADKTLAIPIRPDAVNEGIETLTFTISSPVGAVISAGKGVATVRILDPGRRFTQFAPGFFNTTVNAVVPLPDGKVIIGGDIGAGIGGAAGIRHIARLNADGSVDADFLTGLGFDGQVQAMARQADGKIVVAGDFTSYDGTACNRLVRLNENGTVDTAFVAANGAGPNAAVLALAIEATGKILVAGEFTTFNGVAVNRIVRLLESGARDAVSPVNVDAVIDSITSIYAVVAQADGKILIGGNLWQGSYVALPVDGFRSGLARLNANGSRDATFEVGAGAHASGNRYSLRVVNCLALQPDGKLMVGGQFTAWNGTAATSMVRLNTNGSVDGTFTAPAFNSSVLSIGLQASGRMVVGGGFSSPSFYLTRLTAAGATDATWNPGGGIGGPVYTSVTDSDGALYLGGNFFNYGGASSRPVVKVAGGGGDAYDLWKVTRFSATQLGNGQADPGADADGDGANNLLEMAVGTSPVSAGSVPAGNSTTVVSSGGQEYLQVEFTKGPDAAGLWFGAQFGTNLSSWLPASPNPGSNATYTVIEDSARRLVVRDNTPLSANDRRFGRIHVKRAQ
jgi:uncharacterized delta-60 repeat protein